MIITDNKFKALEEGQDTGEKKRSKQKKRLLQEKVIDENKKSTKQWVEKTFGVDSEGKSLKGNKPRENQGKEMVDKHVGNPNLMHIQQN